MQRNAKKSSKAAAYHINFKKTHVMENDNKERMRCQISKITIKHIMWPLDRIDYLRLPISISLCEDQDFNKIIRIWLSVWDSNLL